MDCRRLHPFAAGARHEKIRRPAGPGRERDEPDGRHPLPESRNLYRQARQEKKDRNSRKRAPQKKRHP